MENIKIAVPKPKDKESLSDNFIAFVEIVKLLRQYCPWDKKQTNESIAQLLIEEAYETIDAIASHNDKEFSKELGDILLHIVMHSVMAEERGGFNMIDVIERISAKLVHRHPHVFGEVNVTGESQVLQNWESLKMQEGRESLLEGVPASMPALLRAHRLQHKASNIGFDWDNRLDVWNKVEEELQELKHEILEGNTTKATEELGDLIFSIVNAARFENIVAEEALQLTNNKFIRRFQYIEKTAAERNRKMSEMTLEEMDALWNEVKSDEKK
jgi:XTP/dITP diphosphohydrolase